ncbi:MAG: 6,7-dimethyl-8-ribityllumazine synthase [Actinomycetales bacterium]|nr:6,7-dimethyl-8-ribityllumazine synthase [Actinomycetales bacterium]
MSGAGAPRVEVDGRGIRLAVVAASWHETVMGGLIAGAERACRLAGAEWILMRVPGSFELPVVAQACAPHFDGIVALGVVIRGGTPHFDYVCDAATAGLARVALDHRIPVGFGLLTCDDEAQALDRAGLDGSREDKGAEAAWAALSTIAVLRSIPPHA